MNPNEVIHLLKGFSYPAEEYRGTVQIEMDPHNEANKVTREEISAALQHKVPMDNIRQITPWTITILF